MMRNLKKRLAILLTLIMIVPYIITCLPVTTLTSEASTGTVEYAGFVLLDYDALVMQVGQSVNIGGFVNLRDSNYGYMSGLSYKGKYRTSDSSVASFDKNGVLTAKRKGKVKVTCKYGNYKITCSVIVKKKNSIKQVTYGKVKTYAKHVKALEKLTKNGITDKNCYKVYNKLVSLNIEWQNLCDKYNIISYNGLVSDDDGYALVVPEYFAYERVTEEMDVYCGGAPAHVTGMGVSFESEKIVATSKKATIKLKEAVTENQFFKSQVYEEWLYGDDDYTREINKTSGPVVFKDVMVFKVSGKKSEYYTEAKVTVTLGSNKLSVKFNKKLPKGTYKICFYSSEFISGTNTFKIK